MRDSRIIASKTDCGAAVTHHGQGRQPRGPVRCVPPVMIGMAVADDEVGNASHRANGFDQSAVDPLPESHRRPRIFQLAKEQVAEQAAGIGVIGYRKRRELRQAVG
jgi:hypothetical protein